MSKKTKDIPAVKADALPPIIYVPIGNDVTPVPPTESAPSDETPAVITRPPKKTEMQLRVEFTAEELLEIAHKLAEATNAASRAEEDKKAVVAQLKAKVDGITAKIGELSGKITAGFEYRTIPCVIKYDDPKVGLKSTYRLDTNALVDTEPMTLAEREIPLPLDESGTKTPARAPQRSVSGNGVVVTEEDDGAILDEDDTKY